jgi:hypothetical protein
VFCGHPGNGQWTTGIRVANARRQIRSIPLSVDDARTLNHIVIWRIFCNRDLPVASQKQNLYLKIVATPRTNVKI